MNLCELGIKQKNYDRELVRAFARANDLPEEEERLEAAAIEEAERKADFLQRFGAAALACEITDELISSVWHGPLCELRILISDHRFHAAGSYSRGLRALSHLFGGVTTSSIIPPNDARHELTYTGPISGAAVMAKVMDRTIDGPSGLLDLGIPTGVAAYMFWASDGKEIHVMENPHSRAPFFYVLKPKL